MRHFTFAYFTFEFQRPAVFLYLSNALFNSNVQECQFTDDQVKRSKSYLYRVVAENEAGESEPSLPSTPLKPRPLRGDIDMQSSRFLVVMSLYLILSDFSRILVIHNQTFKFFDILFS